MDRTPEKTIEKLNELLQRKRGLIQDILKLTNAQTEAISQDGLDRLNGLIKDKQIRIDEINQLDEEFELLSAEIKKAFGISRLDQLDAAKLTSEASAGAKLLKALVADILDVIREISEIEKINSQKSKKLLEQFGNEIKKINQGKKANNAYKAGAYNAPSYFVDKKK